MFTKRFELAILACFELARSTRTVSASKICEWLGISLDFGHQILYKLKKSGLIQTERGSKGGIKLARDPSSITLLDILIAIEPEALKLCCEKREIFNFCVKDNEICRLRNFFYSTFKKIEKELTITIKDFLEDGLFWPREKKRQKTL
ncbi:MAG: Rrf2 family transcriptional regulator [Deltaproteobacteria bacterium]|nr:Rrf2 family transcriptional regulator [Deltaproteobacteria bacterium]MCX7952499.1 Rrf2 family transcriptional regulator [Deltaproteobacteria bacterium]